MNHSHRTDLIDAITTLAEGYPHWRFGQLVANVAGWADAEIWDVEDEQLLSAATAHLEQSPRRRSARRGECREVSDAPVVANAGRGRVPLPDLRRGDADRSFAADR